MSFAPTGKKRSKLESSVSIYQESAGKDRLVLLAAAKTRGDDQLRRLRRGVGFDVHLGADGAPCNLSHYSCDEEGIIARLLGQLGRRDILSILTGNGIQHAHLQRQTNGSALQWLQTLSERLITPWGRFTSNRIRINVSAGDSAARLSSLMASSRSACA